MNPVATPNLAAFTEQWPKTRIGILRRLWPAIHTCLESGHSLRAIHHTLQQDGIEMAYSTLCWAVAILRQSAPAESATRPRTGEPPTARSKPGENRGNARLVDPLRNLKRLAEHRPGFEYNGTLPDEKLFGPR
jgi:hypothetical protein